MNEAVTTALKKLRGHRYLHYELAEHASGSKSGAGYPIDFLAVAVLNRSLALIRGFCDLIESRNFLAAVPLIRLQLDSCLRFSAAWYAPNPQEVAEKVLAGARIRDFPARDGDKVKMHDRYLVDQIWL